MTKERFEWTKEYSVGVRLLDYDHQELFDTVNELDSLVNNIADGESIEQIIDRLSRYATEHFQREEHVLSEYRFPDLSEHRKKHNDFARLIFAVRHILANCPERLSQEKLLMFLEKWLTRHIMSEDMKYRAYMKGGYGNRDSDIVAPLDADSDLPTKYVDKRKPTEMVVVKVHVPVHAANVIRRCARLLQLGGEKAEKLDEITDPIGMITDEEALEIAKVVVV